MRNYIFNYPLLNISARLSWNNFIKELKKPGEVLIPNYEIYIKYLARNN